MATRNRGKKSPGPKPRARAPKVMTHTLAEWKTPKAKIADLERQLQTTEEMLVRSQRENDQRIEAIDRLSARLDNAQRAADLNKRRRDQALSVPFQTRRVTRTLVYTGDPEWVAGMLAKALEDGGHVLGAAQGTIVVKTIGDETTNVRPFEVKAGTGPRLTANDRIPEPLPAMGQGSAAGAQARTPTRDFERRNQADYASKIETGVFPR